MNKKESMIKPFNEEQRRFVRKAFMIEGVQEKFNEWFDNNFIYCQDGCSFIHRCYDAFKECKSYREAQNQAYEQLDLMRLHFLYCTYDSEDLKEKVNKIVYTSPLEKLQSDLIQTEKLKLQDNGDVGKE